MHKAEPFDVVFLDIVMPEINDFDIAKKLGISQGMVSKKISKIKKMHKEKASF